MYASASKMLFVSGALLIRCDAPATELSVMGDVPATELGDVPATELGVMYSRARSDPLRRARD